MPAISRTSVSLKPGLLAPAGIWKAAAFILLPLATVDPATHSITPASEDQFLASLSIQ